jgi:hypothetical protein
VDGDGEGEPQEHARGVVLDRGVDEGLDLGEVDDRVVALAHLGGAHAEQLPVDRHVLASGELGVEPDADTDQRRDASLDAQPPRARCAHARQQAQQRGLARAVAPDDADRLAARHLEVDVAQRPGVLRASASHQAPGRAQQPGEQDLVVRRGLHVALADAAERDRRTARRAHSLSSATRSKRR